VSTYAFETRLSVVVDRAEPDSWCAWHAGLGLAVHGNSTEKALERFQEALGFLFDVLMDNGGPASVKARFDKTGVEFTLEEVKDSPKPRSVPFAHSAMKMLAGAH
jgi:predicted RNase H-like HicB family nuclease